MEQTRSFQSGHTQSHLRGIDILQICICQISTGKLTIAQIGIYENSIDEFCPEQSGPCEKNPRLWDGQTGRVLCFCEFGMMTGPVLAKTSS